MKLKKLNLVWLIIRTNLANNNIKKNGEKMGALFSIVGLAFVISGLLSIANITDVGLNFISQSKIHLLPFLSTYPVVWVYIVLGVILLAIAGMISRR